MVIILPRVKSGSERMAEAFHQTGTSIAKTFQDKREKKEEEEALNREFPGVNFKGMSKDLKGSVVTEKLKERDFNRKQTAKEEEKKRELAEKERINEEKNRATEKARGLEPESLKGDAALNEKLTRPVKEEGGIKAKPIPEKYRKPIQEVLNANRNSTAEELSEAFLNTDIPETWSERFVENRRESAKIPQALSLEEQKLALHRDDNLIKEFEGLRKSLPQLEADLGSIYDALYNGNQSFFSFNNLAEMGGGDLWRDAAGGQFKSGIKNFLVNTVQNLGGRPNQWIEQQMYNAFPKVGQTRSANLMAAETMRFKNVIDKKSVEVFDRVREQKIRPGELGPMMARELADFVNNEQKNLQKRFKLIKKFESQIDAMTPGLIPMVDEDYTEIFFVPPDQVEEGFIMGFGLL